MVYPNIKYRGPGYPDLDPSTTSAGTRELDSRISDGIRVACSGTRTMATCRSPSRKPNRA